MNYRTAEKPYNTLNAYYRHTYGKKVFKVSLNGDFTCPNKDGTSGVGGCTFCSQSGSGDFAGDKKLPLAQQFQTIKAMMHQKWDDAYYIAYFQANTNTYADVTRLKTLYDEALSLDSNIVGLSIATRCDALDDTIYDLLETYHNQTDLIVELGLQSIHDKTAEYINRGHDLDCFTKAVTELRKRGIAVVVHIINGFKTETKEDMLQTIDYINTLDVQGIKIHLLHIMKHTAMGREYQRNPFPILSREAYVDIVCDQIERLHPDIIIHRLTGDSPKDVLLAPLWSLKKFVVMNEIDKELRHRGTYQGIYYKDPN
ncbi:TIGR01212 family radical SAM protein [Candidatus Xianfuyuplasma coldseepsis]|uniref:TIGR01212 family radical SAM protein n=1 Tax=Candidatus Xianfuyuplasma coldseepsis TaxID=2782163 RepID=A0A7L7KPG4_9MOLU|nr:TIGR01212 family radical SAM protein [Xianfuyuplasma coldseepsis]QMS84319.1 TIGR01212 family radical SAM protein [Xianfuyuplasma coldseepsis]